MVSRDIITVEMRLKTELVSVMNVYECIFAVIVVPQSCRLPRMMIL